MKTLKTDNSNGKALPVAINSVMPAIDKSKGLAKNHLEYDNFIGKRDLSEIAAQLRETQHVESRLEQIACLPTCIDKCFDLSYKTKWISD